MEDKTDELVFDDKENMNTMEMDYNEVKSEIGEGSNVVFSRESPLAKDAQILINYKGKKPRLKASHPMEEDYQTLKCWDKSKQERKLSRQERTELGRLFQGAVSSHDWKHAESLVMLADQHLLNDLLCIAVDSIWFLRSRQEVNDINALIQRMVLNGANDFTRAVLRTSFLASCVSACKSKTMSLADTVNTMAQRLHERLQECNENEVLRAEAESKVYRFTEWALKCIGFHSRGQNRRGQSNHSTLLEVHLQLSAFKAFLELAGNNLTGRDFTEAFDAACFPLTLFSSSFDPGWASGVPASAVQGLLGLLVEGGADNVNQCFLEASRFGSTEVVRILLQIAQRNNLDIDVDLALGFASHYNKLSTMECLVEDGHADAFLGPLMRASERGSLDVVQWFVSKGCRDMELCLALTAATSSSQIQTASYLLPHVPRHVISALSIEILKAAGEKSNGSYEGVSFLLRSDFLGHPSLTYAVADSICRGESEEAAAASPGLRAYLKEHWSEAAFREGMAEAEEDYVNFVRVVKRGSSGIRLRELPSAVLIAVVYLGLYRECVEFGADRCRLLPQRLRGRLLVAARRLGDGQFGDESSVKELLDVLRHYLKPFLM